VTSDTTRALASRDADGTGLLAGDPVHVVEGRLARGPDLRHVDVEEGGLEAELPQQVEAARGTGGEMEHAPSIPSPR